MRRGTGERYILKGSRECIPTVEQRKQGTASDWTGWQCCANRGKVKSVIASPTGRTSFSIYKSMQGRKQSQAYAQRDCHRHSRKPLSCKRWHVSFWGSLQSIATVEPDCKNSMEIKGNTWDTFFLPWDWLSLCSTASGTHFRVVELKVWTPETIFKMFLFLCAVFACMSFCVLPASRRLEEDVGFPESRVTLLWAIMWVLGNKSGPL